MRDWKIAKAWLAREMESNQGSSTAVTRVSTTGEQARATFDWIKLRFLTTIGRWWIIIYLRLAPGSAGRYSG